MTTRVNTIRNVDASQPNPERLAQFWRYVAERQRIYYARLSGAPRPWTRDPTLRRYHFTNAFRAADRVTQFVLQRVIYNPAFSAAPVDRFLRIALFRSFNRVGTWSYIVARYGEPRAESFAALSPAILQALLDHRTSPGREHGEALYSEVWRPARLDDDESIDGRAPSLFRRIIDATAGDVVERCAAASTWGELFDVLIAMLHTKNRDAARYVSVLARQIAIDLVYAGVTELDENDYVGPAWQVSASVAQVFDVEGADAPETAVFAMVRTQDAALSACGVDPAAVRLFGRPLSAVDVSQALREFERYSRHAAGGSIARTYAGNPLRPLADIKGVYFPPQWAINARVPPPWRAPEFMK